MKTYKGNNGNVRVNDKSLLLRLDLANHSSDDLGKWRKKLNDKYLCSICGKNSVDSDNGYDTCPECMSKI